MRKTAQTASARTAAHKKTHPAAAARRAAKRNNPSADRAAAAREKASPFRMTRTAENPRSGRPGVFHALSHRESAETRESTPARSAQIWYKLRTKKVLESVNPCKSSSFSYLSFCVFRLTIWTSPAVGNNSGGRAVFCVTGKCERAIMRHGPPIRTNRCASLCASGREEVPTL